jgi:RHS repeat-associated protein
MLIRRRLGRWAGSVVVLPVVLLWLFVPGVASAESLCTDSWIGPAEGSWETPADWSSGKMPGSADVACIGSGKMVNVTFGPREVGVVQGEGRLTVSATFTITNTLEPSTIHTLVVSGGLLGGGGELDITGSFTGSGFGAFTGSGTTVIESGATGTIAAGTSAGFGLNERTLRNAGTLTVGTGSGLQGEKHAHIVNSGTLVINGETASQNHGLVVGGEGATLTNTGTVEKTEGTGVTTIQFGMENEGKVTVTSGKLLFTGGGSSGSHGPGSWSASGSGTGIVFAAGLSTPAFSLGATVPMSGSVEVFEGKVTAGKIEGSAANVTVSGAGTNYGVLEVTGSAVSIVQGLTISDREGLTGGMLTGSAAVDVTSSFTGGGFGALTGTGSTVIEPGATGTITASPARSLHLSERTLENDGTLTAGTKSGIEGEKEALIINTGTLVVNGETKSENHGIIAMRKTAVLRNMGLVEKTEGTGVTPIEFAFENLGRVEEHTGSFEITEPIVALWEVEWGTEAGPSAPDREPAFCGQAEDVNCGTGNLSKAQTDLTVGGLGVGLDLTRTYNSQAAADGIHGVFGYGWSSSFSDHLAIDKTEKRATLTQADGSKVAFSEGTGGTYTPPAWSQDALAGSEASGYTVTFADQTTYKFGGTTGRLESVTDRAGNATTIAYNVSGNPETITDPSGRKLKFAYNAEGLAESVEDPMKHVVKYTYEGGNLKSVTQPGEASLRWQLKYDTSHQLTELIDGRSGKSTFEYNANHQVIKESDPLSRGTKFEYKTFQTLTTNEATGAVSADSIASTGLASAVTKGYGTSSATTESMTYDASQNLLSTTDGNGHTIKYTYDGHANRTSETDPNGNKTEWTYNSTHDVLSETKPNKETTTYEPSKYNPTKVSRPAPESKTQETIYEYNTHGQVTKMTDPLGRASTYGYDSYGDKNEEVDPEGDRRTWSYNEDSQEVSATSPRGNVAGAVAAEFTTTTERDAQGRPTVVSAPQASVGKPVSRVRASVSGMTLEGQTLTAAPGIWEGAPTLAYTYQWERCSATGGSCAAISGETKSTYLLAGADVGHTIRVAVTATNASGSASSTSGVTAVVSAVVMPRYSSQFGSLGSGAGQLGYPYSVAVDSHGNVWVADPAYSRVDEFTSAGVFVEMIGWGVSNGESKYEVCTTGCRAGIAGSGEGQFYDPTGVAVSGGNLYVADFHDDRIDEFNEKSEIVRAFGEKGTGAGQLQGATFVAFDASGNTWVSDYENNRVDEFTSAGVFVETIGWGVSNGESKYQVCTSGCRAGLAGTGNGELNSPVGLAFYGGTLYVADDGNNRVEEFNEKSEYVSKFGSKGTEAGQFEETSMVGVESSTGHLYVNDYGDSRIEEFTSSGSYLGQFGTGGTGNGQFKGPQDVAVTSTGNLYVVDEYNSRIQEWKPASTPVSVVSPSVSGEIVTGQTLTAGTGIWSASPVAVTYTYQWQRCNSAGGSCSNVSGATGTTYTLGSGDTGHRIRVMVKATNTAGSAEAASPAAERTGGPHTTEYAYDGDGNVERVTDPNGNTTHYVYDADNERTKIEESNGTTTETGYDGAGQVTSQTDGNKHTTKYVRNVLEQVTEIVDPMLRKTTKEYDAAGNLTGVTDPAKRTTTYKYDPANRLTEVTYSDGKTPNVKYEYDADGNRTKMTDGTGTTTYTYDQLDRLTESKDGHGNVIKYAYDLGNEQTKITYPNEKNVERAYDKAGRLEKVTDWLTHTIKFTYNPDSELTATVFPTGTSEEDTYTYNNEDHMTEVKMSKGTEVLASLSYARDNNGQLQRSIGKGLPGKETLEYAYDENNRVAKGAGTAYGYDAANDPTTIGSGTYKYDNASELETGPSLKYTYNELGERTKTTPTTGPATTYGYDQAGNLTTVERPKEGETAKIEDTYAYNGDGLRTSETISGTAHNLAWDTSETLPLIVNDGTNNYIYGPSGTPIEQINNSSGAVVYLHHDQQGSTRLITSATGTVEGSYTYTPYGGTEGHTGTATTALGYDGQYTNSDTGLIYLRARSYDPATAQFVSVDPALETTHAPYTYALDNPLDLGDATGLTPWSPKVRQAIAKCRSWKAWYSKKSPYYGNKNIYSACQDLLSLPSQVYGTGGQKGGSITTGRKIAAACSLSGSSVYLVTRGTTAAVSGAVASFCFGYDAGSLIVEPVLHDIAPTVFGEE